MAIYRGPGGAGDATTDSSTEAAAALAAAAEAEVSATSAADSATSASNSATTATTQATNASNSATTAATSASAASTSASNASTSATNAASSATTATTKASEAASSATAAASSASAASTSATNASNSASAASTSATNAASSATSAASSATAAAASYDSFDDRYLGAKSSAPTLDNDGNTLLVGALYFNTVSNFMKVWDGSSWLDAYASLSGALLAANNLSDLTNAATARTNLGLGTAALVADNTLVHLAGTETITGAKTFSSTITGSITGNAGTVTDGVYTSGSYADPTWLTSIAGSKVSGNISGNAATATTATNQSGGTVAATTGSFSSSVTLSGGTANGVAYLNGSKVLTTGSALTFDGSALGTTGYMQFENNKYISFKTSGGSAPYTISVNTSDNLLLNGYNETVFLLNNTEGMRLTSTGLGIGTSSPARKLQVNSGEAAAARFTRSGGIVANNSLEWFDGTNGWYAGVSGSNFWGVAYNSNGAIDSAALRLDSSGNLGLGVTPSTWGSNWKATQSGLTGALASSGSGSTTPTNLVLGAYNDNTNWKYQYSSVGAARYEMTGANGGSTHAWYISAGGTAGNAISFTQAMTLDASGNLGIGTSSPSSKLHVYGGSGTNIGIQSSSGVHWRLGDAVGSSDGTFVLYDYTNSQHAWNYVSGASGAHKWFTAGSERMRIDSSGNLLFNSGYGSVATAYGCRAWVNFNGTGTVAIRASGNVSSITDNGVGDYTVNFTNAMPDANYAWATSAGRTASDANPSNLSGAAPTTSALRFFTMNVSFTKTDMDYCAVSIFR